MIHLKSFQSLLFVGLSSVLVGACGDTNENTATATPSNEDAKPVDAKTDSEAMESDESSNPSAESTSQKAEAGESSNENVSETSDSPVSTNITDEQLCDTIFKLSNTEPSPLQTEQCLQETEMMRSQFGEKAWAELAPCVVEATSQKDVSMCVRSAQQAQAKAAAAEADDPKHRPNPPCSPDIPAVDDALMDPSQWTQQGPDKYQVELQTTEGKVVLAIHRAWAPLGADRFYNLVQSGYLNGIAFFRVVNNFVVQGGMHPNPEVNDAWKGAPIQDEPVIESNKKGRLTYAKSGPNTRSNQLFINLRDNANLDGMGFPPFGEVVVGMDVVESIYSGYGEAPNQGMITQSGAEYLCGQFPNLDRIVSATVVP